MGFMEKSLFSPMAVCSVNPVGCHATVDYLHMPGQAFLFFVLSCFCSVYKYIHSSHICHHVPHHLAQIVAIGVLSCCHFHEMCACAVSWHINVINILLLSDCLYHSLSCETVAQFYKITCNDSMCTHIQVFDSVPLESLLLWLHLDTWHNMVQLGFHHLFFFWSFVTWWTYILPFMYRISYML